jgi:hypothetical protein
MENNYFLIALVLLIIFVASIISYYDLKSVHANDFTGDFCADFSAAFLGCQCKILDSKIHEFNVNISNALVAENLIGSYYESIGQSCSNLECFDLGKGFYSCFCGDLEGTLRSNGEFYRTECGI